MPMNFGMRLLGSFKKTVLSRGRAVLTRLKELRKKTGVRINYSVCKAYEKMTVLKIFVFIVPYVSPSSHV